MNPIIKSIILSLFALSISTTTFAAGLSVTPSKLDETIAPGSEYRTVLTVSNPTQDVSLIEVYPDDLVRFVRVEPREFYA